jgi:hypothetical protein
MFIGEEARLRAIIQQVLVVSLAASPVACGSDGATSPDAGGAAVLDGGMDATTQPPADGGGSVDGASNKLDAASCAPEFHATSPDGAVDAGPDAAGCIWYSTLPCGTEADAAHEGCSLLLVDCREKCGGTARCNVFECGDSGILPAGPVHVECINNGPNCSGVVGRRPAGLRDARRRAGGGPTAEWLAESARLEAASVHAFLRLAAELTEMGAPDLLVREAERSAKDEIRHARVTRGLARRRGAAVARVAVRHPKKKRSIEAFALENAVEGCVRESFGAVVAHRQALLAKDADVRGAMAAIADDETRHAALSWAVAGWLAPRLTGAARARLQLAIAGAVRALRCEVRAMPENVALALGLPSGEAGARLVDAFAAAAWS